jgi:hypothetical protein
MTKSQRYKHEMLVRVRDYGVAHRAHFPESSPGGLLFARVAKAVDAVDDHVRSRGLAGAMTRRVKATTRAAVRRYMKTLAKAARRISRTERDPSPFQMPRRGLLQVQVGAAQAFLVEAERRQAQFIALGLPPTFIDDYRALVNELTQAFHARLNSKTARATAAAGIVAALRQGLDVVRDLEVVVEIATSQNPVLATAWRVARTIEGQRTSTVARMRVPALPLEASSPDQPAAASVVTTDAASPPVAAEAPSDNTTTAAVPVLLLEKAS